MPRFHRSEDVLKAAEHWKTQCLLGDRSVFLDTRLWTPENFAHLDRFYVQNLDEGEGDFWTKLEAQLAPASRGAKQLAAEMFWLMYIIVSDTGMKAGTKRIQIRRVWEWSGDPLPDAEFLLGPMLEKGVAHPGTAYHTHRWREFLYFIQLMQLWKVFPPERQRALLNDPWEFASWLDGMEESRGRQLRHVLLYLLFPETFEPIISGSHKKQIVRSFYEKFGTDPKAVDFKSRMAVDRAVYQVRERLDEEYPDARLSFYLPPLDEVWRENTAEVVDRDPDRNSGETRQWYDETFGSARVWAIGAGEGARLWPEFQRENIVAIGWDSIGDLREYETREEIHGAMKESLSPDANPYNDSLASWQFAHEMAVGDFVIVKRGRSELLALGKVTSDYRFDSGRAEYQGVRSVEWLKRGNWTLPEGRLIATKTLTEFTTYVEWLRFALDLMAAREDRSARSDSRFESVDPPPYTLSDALRGVFLSPEEFKRILDALGRKRNVILEGPPGVGKTYIAKRVAWRLIGYRDPARVEMVQFHQSYAYEDFVQGWRPTENAGFDRQDGVFFRFCEKARQDPENRYVFIIDEINRGNLSKIFGELMMLIEADKRGADYAVPLTYSRTNDERFFVPENVYILGLMNTADRSLAMVDYALRRRFSFIRLEPLFGSERFTDYLLDAGVAEGVVTRIVERLTTLNEEIRRDAKNLGPGFEIGHSYFVPSQDEENVDEAWYESIVHSEIEPLLNEYYFDRPDQVAQLVSRLLK